MDYYSVHLCPLKVYRLDALVSGRQYLDQLDQLVQNQSLFIISLGLEMEYGKGSEANFLYLGSR